MQKISIWAAMFGVDCGADDPMTAHLRAPDSRPGAPTSTCATAKGHPSTSNILTASRSWHARPDADRAALPPALVLHRHGDGPLPQSFHDEGARYLQTSGLVCPASANAHRGRVEASVLRLVMPAAARG